MNINQFFCCHNYKIEHEHVATFDRLLTERVGIWPNEYNMVVRDFWGRPIITQVTVKILFMCCTKCGKNKQVKL